MRTALITVALICGALQLLPGGSRLGNREVWKTKHNQAQFAQWSEALGTLGIDLTPKQFEDELWRFVRSYLGFQRPAARALRPLSAQLGVNQSWRMFSNPQTHPARVHVDLDRGAGFAPLYVSRSDEFDWRRKQFDHNRMRKLVGRIVRKGRPRSHREFVNWIAAQTRDEFPDATRVRVRLFRWPTPSPAELAEDAAVFDAEGRFESARVVELGEGDDR